MLGSFVGWMVTWGCISAVWADWLADIFGQKIRGTATGLIWGAAALAGAASACVAGRLLAVSVGPAMSLGMAGANLILGRLGDRYGHRMGICLGSGIVSHYNMLFETCPHDSRVIHITLGNLCFGLGSVLLSFLAGRVAAEWGLFWLFRICLAISLLALGWFACLVREPRTIPTEITGDAA